MGSHERSLDASLRSRLNDPAAIPSEVAGRRSSRRLERATAISASFIGLLSGYPSSYAATATTFIVPLTRAFGWGRLVPSTMYVASMIGIAVASIWIGRIIERAGAPRVALLSGAALALVMALLGAQSGSVPLAILLCFLAGVLGSGTSVGLYLSIIPKWFERNLGRALGFSIVGLSAGVVTMPAIATTITNTYGWRVAYVILGATQLTLTMLAAGMLWWLSRREPELAPTGRATSLLGSSLREAMAMPSFWRLGSAILLASTGVFGITVHLFPLYADRGLAAASLPLVALSMGVGTLTGRISSGLLLDRFEARLVAAATFATGAIGILWFALSGPGLNTAVVFLTPALIGAALGAESDILAFIVRRLYGLRHYPAIYNRLLIAWYGGSIAGTLFLGWIFDQLHSPRLGLIVMAMSCIAGSALAATLPSTRRPG